MGNPIALGCGHLVTGFFDLRYGGGNLREIKCPEGCGWQEFVQAPDIELAETADAKRETDER